MHTHDCVYCNRTIYIKTVFYYRLNVTRHIFCPQMGEIRGGPRGGWRTLVQAARGLPLPPLIVRAPVRAPQRRRPSRPGRLPYITTHRYPSEIINYFKFFNINGRDVQRKNVVNNVDKSSLWAP